VQQVEWTGVASDGVPLGTSADNAMSLPQQVERWGALVDVEGVGYSGRLKLLLHAGRPVLVADRPWREWYWDGLTPMEHYVPVRRDLSDLVERAEWVRTRPQEADRIGRAGQRFARRVLTRAGAVARWAEVLSLAPHATGEWAPPAVRDALADVLAEIGAMRSAS
jgi:glycosyltransferase involved in cell wall biosynthesis